MQFVDVIFPLSLGPLTYRVPDSLKRRVAPGTMVEAEIKKSMKRGIILGPSVEKPGGAIKAIEEVRGDVPALGAPMLELIQWMAGYYLAKEGEVLKSIFPREFFQPVSPRGGARNPETVFSALPPREGADQLGDTALEGILDIRERAEKRTYGTFLVHAPSTPYELAFLLETMKGMRNVIVLLPDHAWIERIASEVATVVGEGRLVLYHAGLSRGRRSEALKRIVSGDADVVLGSRGAVFAPLKRVSLIAVLQEESTAYKEGRGVRYNARDMAVMRGNREGAAVVLSSICPAVESYHNAEKGKYVFITPPPTRLRPRVRLVDMRRTEEAISPTLRREAVARLAKGEKVMLYVNRKGFSLLQCTDCGHLEKCPRCDIPLVFYKGSRALRCGYCGRQSAAPAVCPACGSYELRPVGTGMERVEEEIGELNPVGVEKKTKKNIEIIAEADGGLAVGTKVLTRSAGLSGAFSLAGVINADGYLYIPDFRSAERAWQDLVYTVDRVKPGGQLIIQTRYPGSRLLSLLRNFNSRRFYETELRERKELGYPPYAKMALITVEGGAEPRLKAGEGAVEVLGPVQAVTRRGKKVFKVLIKAPSTSALKPAVDSLLESLKGRRVSKEVDPLEV